MSKIGPRELALKEMRERRHAEQARNSRRPVKAIEAAKAAVHQIETAPPKAKKKRGQPGKKKADR